MKPGECTFISWSYLDNAHGEPRSRLDHNVETGRMSAEQVEDAFSKPTFTTHIDESSRSAGLVVEAIVEKLDLNRELFS